MHGVKVLEADVNYSEWDKTLEAKDGQYHVLRLGFRQIKGLKETDMLQLVAMRNAGYQRIDQLRAAGVPEAALEKLANVDAFVR